MKSKQIYSKEQQPAFENWSSQASKEYYLHDESLDKSNIFQYPDIDEEEDNDEVVGCYSWIDFQERKKKNDINNKESTAQKLLESSLTNIFKTNTEPESISSISSLLQESENNQDKGLITLTPRGIMMIIGLSFSLGYMVGLQGFKYLKNERFSYVFN